MKRALLAVLAAMAAASFVPTAQAQDYPTKPMRLIVSQAAGGGVDFVARSLADLLKTELGQPIVVENRPGASGTIAASYVLTQPADGYTLHFSGVSALSWAPLIQKPKYDAERDFDGVAMVANSPFVIATSSTSRFTSFPELVRIARQSPGKVSYASFGVGNSTHLVTELIAERAQIQLHHVPFNSSAAVTSTAGGTVDLVTGLPPNVAALVKAGRLKVLAVTGDKRAAVFPDTPTFKEMGFDVEAPGWLAVVVKKGTPQSIIDKLNAAINKVVAMPDMQEKLALQSLEPLSSNPEDVVKFIARDKAGWTPLIRRLNISE